MKRFIFTFLVLIIASLFINSNIIHTEKCNNYNKQWLEIKVLKEKGLTKSALKIVDKIYKWAKKDENGPQLLKALIYRASLNSTFQENYILKTISAFENELSVAGEPEKSIIYSLLAQLYQTYYQQNRYKIINRSIIENNSSNEIQIWDAKKFNHKIKKYYLLSVANEKLLKTINLSDYSDIITPDKPQAFNVQPTLFDLLAQRAVNYFSSTNAAFFDFVKMPLDTTYIVPANKFIKIDFSKKSPNSKLEVLRLFKEILSLHLQNKNSEAFVEADLKRLKYVKENITDINIAKTSYIKALKNLLNEVKSSEAMMPVAYQLAEYYYSASKLFDKSKDSVHQHYYIKSEKICRQAIKSYPHSKWAKAFNGIIQKIYHPSLHFKVAETNVPNRPFLIRCNYRNVDTLYIKIVPYQFDIQPKDWQKTKMRLIKLRKHKGIYNTSFILPDLKDYSTRSAELELPPLPTGQYIVFLSDNKIFSKKRTVVYKQIQISSISYIIKKNPVNKTLDVYVLNRESGKTIAGAGIIAYRQEYDRYNGKYNTVKVGDYITGNNGFVNIPIENTGYSEKYLFNISKNGDNFYAYEPVWFWNTNNKNTPVIKTWFFTDRAIYRPGQTVLFKGIIVKQLKNADTVVGDKNITVELLNANYKKISSLQLRSNSFGSVQGGFVLPSRTLNGRFTLRCSTGSTSFRVEEYKRPTFYVKFDTISNKYKLNDIVKVTGHAVDFAGSPLNGAKIQYRVKRKAFIFGNYYFPFPQQIKTTEITNGELITSDDGTFEITFKALPAEENTKTDNYNFDVTADVTDITGEVHSGETNVNIGKNPFVLYIDAGKTINREQNNGIVIIAKNLSGKTVNVNIALSVYKLSPPTRILAGKLWNVADTVLMSTEKFKHDFPHIPYGNETDKETWPKKNIVSRNIYLKGKGTLLKNTIKHLKPGQYLISIKSVTADGSIIKANRFITIYSEKLKKLQLNSILWLTADKMETEPGKIVKLFLYSAAKNTKVLLQILSGDKTVRQEWLTLSKKQKEIDVPIKESYRGIIFVKATTVRYNRNFSTQQIINVPFTNKKLHITLETNRNFLKPGKKEDWRINIKGYKNEKVAAELLIGMYDASLDQFAVNNWNFNLFHPSRPGETWNAGGFIINNGSALFNPKIKYFSTPQIIYPHINWFDFQMYSFGGRVLKTVTNSNMDFKQTATPVMEKQQKSIDFNTQHLQTQLSFDGSKQTKPSSKQQNTVQEPFKYRKNFNETAFFYPELRTDSLGNVSFSFKTPDALTEWKLIMLAHTRNLKIGTMIKKIKAHKNLMILVNKPRFVRAGDIFNLSGKTVNFTGKSMTANITINFFNPFNNKPIKIVNGKSVVKLSLLLPAGKSVSFSKKIEVPYNIDLIAYHIKAITENFTDGIEDDIPVLPVKMLVTETMPFTIKGNSKEIFNFDKLISSNKTTQVPTVDNYRYTVEFTSNPIWYAVQALPYLATPKYESAQNLFNSYYANSIASGIITRYPKIKTVLKQWKHSSPDAFLSNLQKNQELKNILLDATPWVLQAKNESEQKHRIALLFNMNNLSNQLEESLHKLQNMQLSSGAWSWFKGMYPDRYVTQDIVSGFARLKKMKFYQDSNVVIKKMLEQAIYYLDNKITKDFNKLKSTKNVNLKKEHISSLQINYLYARTAFLDQFPLREKNKEAFNYYIIQVKNYWLKQNNYLQAMIAIVMERMDYRNEAEGIIRSLTERSLESNKLGMYWRHKTGWYWYQAPVETEVMIMEAYDVVMHDRKKVEKMKIWLLKNKQTNRWKTSTATANAIYGLLMRGNNLLNETKAVSVVVGSKPLQQYKNKAQAGTGYIKKSWMRTEIKPDMGIIKVSNPNSSIAWGAAYYQYFENLDKIKSHQTELQIEKKYFIEKFTPEGPVITPLLPDKKLTVGQKVIIRLVIKTDRKMEYIYLKDMHAASFEPVENISGTKFKGGLMYYENIKDASVDFFISNLPKGIHELEYSLRVTQKGSFSSGIATVQSLYAPEFAAHSSGRHILVK